MPSDELDLRLQREIRERHEACAREHGRDYGGPTREFTQEELDRAYLLRALDEARSELAEARRERDEERSRAELLERKNTRTIEFCQGWGLAWGIVHREDDHMCYLDHKDEMILADFIVEVLQEHEDAARAATEPEDA